ncbi:methionine ABC transporter ATP-binding protein [Sphingobacterium lumbrici]|uniref:methionine ABC transporter ATP-binding protein n=1 Tax=Sphingobacterium lumbrici TaxID=2559600 RepID=UPI00112DDC13|nr:ATP-binding cassette domain-containing protein [Sphingobacterium lumbrici]
MINLDKISKVFHKKNGRVDALKEITLHIDKGDIFGIIGSSGAGKSTLIRTVNLLERPTSGHIFWDKVDLAKLGDKALIQVRRKIGMIFQQFNLLSSRTVYDNIAFPLELVGADTEVIRNKVERLLALVDLLDKKDEYPANLSGGQKQRVAIGRALASDPEILLCDEATSALDPHTTRSILALLRKINRELGITIILITHEMEVVRAICNRVAVIAQGEIIEQNDVESLFLNPQTQVTKDLLNPSLRID